MNNVFAGAMMTIMALCVFGIALPIGGINPEVAAPAYFLVVLLALLWAGWLVVTKETCWTRSPMHWPIALFVAYSFVRYFTAPLEHEARVELFQIGVCALIYFCSAGYFYRARDRAFFLILIMSLGLVESGYGIWQAFTKSPAVFFWERPEGYLGRASGTFIYPNQFAALLEMVLGFVLARILLVRRESQSTERSVILKCLSIYVGIMIALAIALSRSRAGWIGTIAGLGFLFLIGDWRPRFTWPRFALAFVLVVLVGIGLWNLDAVQNHVLRTVALDQAGKRVALEDQTLGGRIFMWKGTVKMFADHPIVGTGGGSWQWFYQKHKDPRLLSRPDYTHNDFLNLASDYGGIGVILMLWLFVAFYRQAWKISRPGHFAEKQAFAVGAMVAVSSLLVHCWFDFNLHIPVNAMVLAAIMGTTAAMTDNDQQFDRQPIPRASRYLVAAAVVLLCAVGLWKFIPTAIAYRYTDLGNQLRKELEYEAAMAWYEEASRFDPKFPEPPARIGDIHRTWALWRLGPEKLAERRKFARQAVEWYEASLKLNPYQAFVLIEFGRVLEMAGDNERALEKLKQAIEVYPANALAFFMLGCFYRDHGQLAQARQAFLRSQELNYVTAAGINSFELQPQQ